AAARRRLGWHGAIDGNPRALPRRALAAQGRAVVCALSGHHQGGAGPGGRSETAAGLAGAPEDGLLGAGARMDPPAGRVAAGARTARLGEVRAWPLREHGRVKVLLLTTDAYGGHGGIALYN